MKRLLYNDMGDGIFKGSRRVRSKRTGALYEVEYNVNEMTFRVTNMSNGHIVKRNKRTVTNLNVLKRGIKRALKELGVEFEIEIRNRNYGVVRKEKND